MSIFAVLLGFLVPAAMTAQAFPDNGIKPSGSYFSGSVDNVDLFTGNISGSIPIVSYPQLGKLPPLTFSLNFNTAPYTEAEYCDPGYYSYCDVEETITSGGGPGLLPFSSNLPDSALTDTLQICTYGNNWVCPFNNAPLNNATIYGSGLSYVPLSTSTGYYTYTDATGYTRDFLQEGSSESTGYLYATDGSGYSLVWPLLATGYAPGAWGTTGPKILTPTGLTITNISQSYNNLYSFATQTDSVSDPSGNTILHQNYGIGQQLQMLSSPPQYVDSLGRVIPDFTSLSTGIVSDNDGDVLYGSADVSHCPTIQGQSASWSAPWTVPSAAGGTTTYYFCTSRTAPSSNMAALALPNGTSWGFIYNTNLANPSQYNDTITDIYYPTGGHVHYDYQVISRWPDWGDPEYYFAVTKRTEYDTNGNARPTYYAYATLSPASFTTTVTDGLGNQTVHTFTALAGPNVPQAYETRTDYYQGAVGGTPLRTVTTQYSYKPDQSVQLAWYANVCYYYAPNGLYGQTCQSYGDLGNEAVVSITNVVPISTVTTDTGGATTTTTYSYDHCSDPVTICNYSLSQPRQVVTTDSLGNSRGSTNDLVYETQENLYGPPSPTAPNATNQLNLVADELTTTGGNNANALNYTSYGYDENNGSPQGAFGNQTSSHAWLNTSGGSIAAVDIYGYLNQNSSSLRLTSQSIYNSQGGVTETLDGNGNATVVLTSQCSGLFPQTVQVAANSTSPLPETTSQSLDCTTGQLNGSIDPNGVMTQYSYDLMGRPIQVVTAAGTTVAQSTTITYPSMNEADIAQDKDSLYDGKIKTKIINNGLGQVAQNVLANGAVVVTSYNGNGQVSSVTNPYWSITEPTYGATTYYYDALGRKTVQLQSDGVSKLQWCYNGIVANGQGNCRGNATGLAHSNWIDQADEANNDWQLASDGLGQLRQVVEPGGLRTSYGYDSLGNLNSIVQQGLGSPTDVARIRSLFYDSLSRLVWASNPESGYTCYGLTAGAAAPNLTNCMVGSGYDGNGNLLYKTDARGIATVYAYDSFNRLTQKTTKTSDPTNTIRLFTLYNYDSSGGGVGGYGSTLLYGIGRLQSEWTIMTDDIFDCAQRNSAGICLGPLTSKTIFAYDPRGRVLSEQQCVQSVCSSSTPGTPSYTYDLAGDLTGYTDGAANAANVPIPGGITLSAGYDNAAQLRSVISNWADITHPASLFSGSEYSASGGLRLAQYGPGLSVTRHYDSRLRLTGEQDLGSIVLAPPVPGTAVIGITGTELSK